MLDKKRSLNRVSVQKRLKKDKVILHDMTVENYEIPYDENEFTTFIDYYSALDPFKMPISLYKYAPKFGQCDLSKFQECSVKRLALLQFLDTCSMNSTEEDRGNPMARKGDRYGNANTNGTSGMENKKKLIRDKIFFYNFGLRSDQNSTKEKMEDIIMKDVLSHFILRVAFSKEKDKQKWFLKQELKLFTFRLNELKNATVFSSTSKSDVENGLIELMKKEHMHYDFITKSLGEATKSSVNREEWEKYTSFIPNNNTVERVFKIPFYPDAYPLVAERKVYVEKGIAYVPDIFLDCILTSQFVRTIKDSFEELERTEKSFAHIPPDPRIAPFFSALPKAYVAKDFRQDYQMDEETRLTPQILYAVYKESFPPCMRRIFVQLIKEKHIKHWARQQLWLFLKGAGFTLDENIHTNRSVWAQPDKFDKEHRYNIRYMYGKEGKKTDFNPYNCLKIITSFPVPSGNEPHGCPFKNFDENHLRNLLYMFGLNEEQMKPVLAKKATHDYQLACKQFFIQTHPGSTGDGVGSHPNSFYLESRKYYKEKATKKETEED